MIRLLLSDLRHHAGVWAWTSVVAVVTAAAVAAQLQVVEGLVSVYRDAGDPVMAGQARDTFWVLVAPVGIAAASVLSSVTSLATGMRRRDHGLWKALGMPPGTVRLVVLGQVGVVGLLAGVVGTPLGTLLARPLVSVLAWDQDNPVWDTVEPRMVPAQVVTAALVVAAVTVAGGLRASREAATASEAALLGGRPEAESGLGRRSRGAGRGPRGLGQGWRRRGGQVLRMAWVLGAAVVYARLLTGIYQNADKEGVMVVLSALGCGLAALVLVVAAVPWVVPPLERVLAGLVPSRGVAAFVAGRTCAQETTRSTTTVMPFVVALGVVAVTYGGSSVGGSVTGTSLLALPFLVAWVGGVAVIAMGAGRRRRDAALLEAAGARRADVLVVEILEGVVHAVAAILLGLVVSLATSVAMAAASEQSLLQVVGRSPWRQLGVVAAATLTTIALSVVLSSRLAGRRDGGGVSQVLRARD